MQAFFYLILLFLIPGLLARIDIGGGGILPTDILVPAFCALWIGKKIVNQERFPPLDGFKYGLIFVFIALVTFFFGAWDLDLKEKFVSAAYLVRLISFLIFAWAAADIFAKEPVEKFLDRLFNISFIVVIIGFVQFYLLPDISDYSTEGGLDPHIGRLLGTWLDPNYMAGFLGFMIPLGIARLYHLASENSSHRNRKLCLNTLFILAALFALFLTFSRSGYLAAGIGLLFFFFWKDPKIILLGVLVVTIGITTNQRAQERMGELAGTFSAIVLQETDEIDPTATLRIQNWMKSYELFEKYPLTGIGYNTYRYNAAKEGVVDENFFSSGGADSTHLTVLVTTGIFGFFAYLVWLWQLGWTQLKRYLKNKKSQLSLYNLAFVGGLLAMLVHASFVNSLFFPLIFLPMMAVFGALNRD